MIGEILLDTNILIYAYDRSEPEKQARALAVLDRLATTGAGVLSTQVLSEFFVIATRKIAHPLTIPEAIQRLQNYNLAWKVVQMTSVVILEAARGVYKYKINFWDAQIWAVARLNQIPILFSEDFNPGSSLEGVRFVNPFDPEFRLDDRV